MAFTHPIPCPRCGSAACTDPDSKWCSDNCIMRLNAEIARLREDAERWRLFEESGHLMIVDFDRREAGSFKMTKRAAIDAVRKDKP